MNFLHDVALQRLIEGVIGLLVVATVAGRVLALRAASPGAKEAMQNLNRRVNAWWVMCVVFGLALLTGGIGSYVLFGLLSFLALREFGDWQVYLDASAALARGEITLHEEIRRDADGVELRTDDGASLRSLAISATGTPYLIDSVSSDWPGPPVISWPPVADQP